METFAFLVYPDKINNKNILIRMKLHNFNQFVISIQTNEDVESGESPIDSGFEGTSAEPMNYHAGDYGETGEEDTYIDDEEQDPIKIKAGMENMKALINDLTERINTLQKNKKK